MYLRKFFTLTTCLLIANLGFSQSPISTKDDFCYAKLKAPDQYDVMDEQVLIKAASTRIVKLPAVYETKTEEILVKPESKKMSFVPAVYKTVTEQIVDKPESKKIISIPAVIEKRTERVLIQEESKRMVPVAAVYENVNEQILIRPETRKFKYIPAVFETKTEQVVAKAAAQNFVPIPAEYETVMEQIEVEPAITRIETLTPKYKTITERVMTKPSFNKWVKSKSDETCLSANPEDCQIWCLVEIPAEYNVVTKMVNIGCDGSGEANSGCKKEIQIPAKYQTKAKKVLRTPATSRAVNIPEEYSTVSRSVLKTPATFDEKIIPAVYKTYKKKIVKTPATVKEVIIPAVYDEIIVEVVVSPARTEEQIIPATYKTITKRVIESPASVKEELIPAVYETIKKRELVTPETEKMEEIPAQYKTVSKRVLRQKGDMQWKRIVCPKYQTSELNGLIQDALRNAGFNPGPTDKIFGPRTYAAMIAFQKANNLWFGHLDYTTVNALNVPLSEEALKNPDGTSFAMNSNNEDILSSRGGTSKSSGNSNIESSENTDSGNNSSSSNENEDDSNNEDSNTTTSMSSEEMQMIDEINLMRKDPKGYVKYVEEYINQVKNDAGLDASYKAEEISSAKELISELKNLSPLQTLKPHEGLHKVGIKHGKDVQGQGMIGHRGTDGTMPWDRVRRDTKLKDGNENLVAGGGSVRESFMILLVDSGIPGRGHRRTLLEPKWNHVGVNKIGDVGGIPNAWIQVFGTDK